MIPYGRHSISESDIAAVVAALKSDWLTTGPLVEKFEIELEKLVGAPCITVSSGTAALHCAFAAIELAPSDEVITPPLTFIATQATASFFGAKIRFADIQSDTGNIDPSAVEAAITPMTKAIVAVDYAGHPAELSKLRKIADRHGVYLIEDASHSLGSLYDGLPVGSIADITTFSFFPTKNITTAEGGAVASIRPDLLERAKRFSRQGMIRNPDEFYLKNEGPWHQEVHTFGLNYRLPDVLCALGISQLGRIEETIKRKEEIVQQYTSLLEPLEKVKLPIKRENVRVNWHLFPIRVPKNERRVVFNQLRDSGIQVQVNYLPAHLHPVFSKDGYSWGDFPVSEEFYLSEISLPLFPTLSPKDVEYVAKALRS
jgi:dTDP-4-amino-4,6-dideoxygalactose transaminase